MIDQQTAARDLHAIRSLLERATLYRTISGPTALFGAVLSLLTALALGALSLTSAPIGGFGFVLLWIVVLVVTTTFNFALIHRDSVRRDESFLSSGMRLALRTIAPPMFVGGIIGITLALRFDQSAFAAIVWILCYGLALCATAGFAPKSIKLLGAAFIASGAGLLPIWYVVDTFIAPASIFLGAAFMGSTFGLLHLIYGICVVFAKEPSPDHESVPV